MPSGDLALVYFLFFSSNFMTSILQTSQLSGVQLESFLDQFNAHIQEQENAGLAENLIQENCLALLSNQQFEPQNRMHIANLFRARLRAKYSALGKWLK